jgi:hypothetical protein
MIAVSFRVSSTIAQTFIRYPLSRTCNFALTNRETLIINKTYAWF